MSKLDDWTLLEAGELRRVSSPGMRLLAGPTLKKNDLFIVTRMSADERIAWTFSNHGQYAVIKSDCIFESERVA